MYIYIYIYILRVCLSAEGAKNVSWPLLSPLRGWGSLTMAFTGKFVYIYMYVYTYIYIYELYVFCLWQPCHTRWSHWFHIQIIFSNWFYLITFTSRNRPIRPETGSFACL